jgi:two-component system sensor histidine kinase UhpB
MRTNSSAIKSKKADLSVSHKAASGLSDLLHHLPDAIIITDLSFNITGWNDAAEKLHGLPGAMGKNLFKLIKLDLINSTFETIQKDLSTKKSWDGEVIYHRHDGEKFIFRSTANIIINESNEPVSFLFVNHNITQTKNTERKLEEAEASYEKLVNTLVDGVVMIGKDGKIKTCNKKAAQILGLSENELRGKVTASPSWKAIKPDGSVFPLNEFPAIVSLQTGFPQRNVKMGVEQPDGTLVWLMINSEALIRAGEFEPYAVVVSFSDITDTMKRDEELRKSNERFFYVSKVTSDAIWDLDLVTNEIYRSEAFCELSGYSNDNIQPDLDWWFQKVHPDDRERVQKKVNEHIKNKKEKWEDEYRFICADGKYKYLLDTGIILYRNGKPVRILGAIRDLTERKKLEQQLLFEQEQKLKAISQAAFAAQEQERNNISRELHDNVNQILMSAKLFMSSAKNEKDKADEYIDKSLAYQMMAVDEIRKLSHRLNSSLVSMVGLKRAIDDITVNLFALKSISVQFDYDAEIDHHLSEDQQLMIYRIIQEQTNNILKYSSASSAIISVRLNNNIVHLTVSDNGKGFDTSQPARGIGLVNISNRVDAFGGTVNLQSSPGKGCKLEIQFPLTSN